MRPEGGEWEPWKRERKGRTRPVAPVHTVWICLPCLIALLSCAGQVLAEPPQPDHSQASVPQSPLQVSLLTIGPGALYFERFGHNAIVVRDADGGPALAYNYGIFDFDEQDFLLNFARGRMRYRIAVDDLDDDLAQYRAERREIVEQPLDLTPAQARALASFLDWNVRPENAWYRYDYFEANCSTRVRDAIDRALGGALHAQSEGRSRGYTYRLDALRLMAPQPWLMIAIDLGLGPAADRRIDYWEESFVPATLRDLVARVGVTRADGSTGPLAPVEKRLAVGAGEEPPALPPDLRWPFLFAGVVLGGVLGWLGRARARAPRIALGVFAGVFELACGLGGVLLLFLWFGTEHHAAWRNENLLLLDPLCLALVPGAFGLARRAPRAAQATRAIAWLVVLAAAFALFSKILPAFAQANLHWIVLLLPIHLALALALARPPTGA